MDKGRICSCGLSIKSSNLSTSGHTQNMKKTRIFLTVLCKMH